MVKRWLDDKGINYDDVLVDRDPIAAQKMVTLSGQMGVPFITIEDGNSMQKVLGYNVPSLEAALAN